MAVRRKKKAASKTRRSANDNAPAAHRGGRPAWQGHLRLSLVSCPVALINATTRANDISFHLINPDTNNRIRMIPTDPDKGPVERSDLVKGYEVSKDEYVIVTDDELNEVRLETTRSLDIERFVDAGDIDRLYWNDPYFLVPDDDESGVEAYAVIREAMAKSNRIALGRVVMHTRERLVAIEPRDNGMIAYTLRMYDEVRDPSQVFRDIPDARPDRVRTELLQHEVQVESLGGDVVDVEVSAKNKTNLDKLLEMIALQAELLDLKTNASRPAEGTVIEAKLDRGRGPVATVLVQRGTLRVGDIIVAGAEMGRVRALINDQGQTIQEAGPSMPVEVLGFNGPPEAGDRLAVVENEARARQVTDYRAHQKREKSAATSAGMRGSLEQMMSQLKTSGRKDFPLVVKADVQGSLEAIIGSLDKLGTEEVAARILHAGVGGISESDVTLAEGFNAAIIGFSVRANKEAAALAKRDGIEIRYYNIIYDLVDDVKKAMSGLLAPTLRETMLGNAQVLEVFHISKVGKIAGCRVTDGTVERGANVRLIRDNVVIHEGKLSQLKRFKDDAKEVVAGQECGMSFENYQDMRPGDVIECYRVETIQRSL